MPNPRTGLRVSALTTVDFYLNSAKFSL
ncbi:unnamed protein product [Phytomonas sp. Hart1]|nr:unnamed protein product [Phytomonas sp. Hart1]|eukprot:CCW69208.1 unnamed protein product [Phytomonas sp. isolate Hart1]